MCFLPAAEQRRCQPAKSRADDRANHRHRAAERRAKGRTGQRGAGAPCAKPRSKAAGNAAVLVLGKPQRPAEQRIPERTEAPVHERGTEGKATGEIAAAHSWAIQAGNAGGRTGKLVTQETGNPRCPRIGQKAGERQIAESYSTGATIAPRRIRHPARAEHTGHHTSNLNRDGPGDGHMHQIGKERREQRLKGRQRHLSIFHHLLPCRFPAGIHAGEQATESVVH